jgi:RNA recognition motif-containing protein
MDKRLGKPRLTLYRDKVTNALKGDAIITYEDPHAAAAAIRLFNGESSPPLS